MDAPKKHQLKNENDQIINGFSALYQHHQL